MDHTLFSTNQEQWVTLIQQGHCIDIIDEHGEVTSPPIAIEQSLIPKGVPDLYLAPYAMRMTPDMLTQLPTAFTLAIRGARDLRYGPTIKKGDPKWKGAKGAQGKKTRTRKNSAVKAEDTVGGEPLTASTSEGVGGAVVNTTDSEANNEGVHST